MRASLIVVAVLAGGAVAAALLAYRASGDDPEFVAPAVKLLGELAPGPDAAGLEEAAGRAYDGASFFLRDSILRDKFIDQVVDMNETLGRFQRVAEVIGEERLVSAAGDVVRVDLQVEFARARTESSISLHRRRAGEPWLLLGLRVDVPESLAGEAGRRARDSTYGHDPAPPELASLTAEILAGLGDGKLEEVYERAAAPFREAHSLEAFAEIVAAETEALGRFVKVIDVITADQSAAGTRARLYAWLAYEKHRTTGTFEFAAGASGEGEEGAPAWRLLSYRVELPEPFPPPRAPEQGVGR